MASKLYCPIYMFALKLTLLETLPSLQITIVVKSLKIPLRDYLNLIYCSCCKSTMEETKRVELKINLVNKINESQANYYHSCLLRSS